MSNYIELRSQADSAQRERYPKNENFWTRTKSCLRVTPPTISLSGYTLTAIFAIVYGIRKAEGNEDGMEEATNLMVFNAIATAANIGSVSVIKGLSAVKTLCTRGKAAAKKELCKTIRPGGLLFDTIFPNPCKIFSREDITS